MTKTPLFKNRQNPCVKVDDKPLWVSRSCAVVAEVLIHDEDSNEWYVLLNQRGTHTPDFQGYWSLPCGYLDWDETLPEAVAREVFEECGVYLPAIADCAQYVHSNSSFVTSESWADETPWKVTSDPHGRQNVSMHYAVLVYWKGSEFPVLSADNCEPGEVADLGWVKLSDALTMQLAFNHHSVLSELSQIL